MMCHMFIEHFDSQNAADLSKRLQMIDVNDVWSQCIIQNCTDSLQIGPNRMKCNKSE